MNKFFSLVATLLATTMLIGCSAEKKVGLQLYSVHQDMGDVAASLQKVADAGYNVVETLGSQHVSACRLRISRHCAMRRGFRLSLLTPLSA